MSKSLVECEVCHKQGDGFWAGWHKKNIHDTTFTLLYEEEDEPPPKSNKNSFKLCFSYSRDLDSAIFGCQPLVAGNNNFRSLAWASRFG